MSPFRLNVCALIKKMRRGNKQHKQGAIIIHDVGFQQKYIITLRNIFCLSLVSNTQDSNATILEFLLNRE